MATSKSRNTASKAAPAKKNAAPANGRPAAASKSAAGNNKKAAQKSPVKAAAKKSAPAKAPAKSASKKAPAAQKNAGRNNTTSGNTAAKKTASRSTATKAAASSRSASKAAMPSRNGTARKAAAGRGTALNTNSARTGGSAANARNAGRTPASRGSQRTKATGNPQNDLEKILQDLLKDIYYAEKKLTKSLGKMARSATHPKLKDAFTTHQAQTEDQIAKLEQAFELMGMKPKAVRCAAMDGLLEEANEHIEEYERGAGLDAALIVGAQKVEHYEISAYGSMRSISRTLGYKEAADIFESIREQESDTDELLTTLAEGIVNLGAESESKDISGSSSDNDDKSSDNDNNNGNTAGSRRKGEGATDSDAGEDSSSAVSGNESDDSGSSYGSDSDNDGTGRGAISGLTDGNDRGEASETGEAMGY